MPDVVIAAKLEADAAGAINSVKNFKQELRLAQEEVIKLSEKFGATSKEAQNAAKRAAELKDAVGDAKSLIDAFNPDTKFRAFGASINTVVGGFTALQGVLGLVGSESEDVQKALLKVQSALAISQGIAQLQEGVQTFKNLGAVIKATTIFQQANTVATNLAAGAMRLFGVQTVATSTAMNVLKGAIIATGIGALVILLGVAANAMGLFSDGTEDAADSQAKLNEQMEKVNGSLAAQSGFFTNAERLEIAQAKRRGASEAEIFAIQEKFRRLNYDATAKAYEQVSALDKEQGAKLLQSLNDQNTAGQVAKLNFETQEIERIKSHNEKLSQLAKEALQKRLKEAADDQRRQGQVGLSSIDAIQIEVPKTLEQLQTEANVLATQKSFEEKTKIWEAESLQRTEAYTNQKDQIKALEEAELIAYENRRSLLESTGGLFNTLGSIIGKQTAAGKVLGIAQATINTFIGATEVLRSKSVLPEPFGTIAKIANVAAVIATGLSAVKQITKTNVPGAGGSASVPSVQAPIVPQAPQQTSTTLDQASLNAIGNATTRSFVLESDITNSQERITRLNRAARIG